MAKAVGLPTAEFMLVAQQLIAKGWVHYTHKPLSGSDYSSHKIGVSMPGIEEAEKMERTWFQRFYEDHVVLWSLVLLILGFVLSTISGVAVNVSRPAAVINVPAPVVNIPAPVVNIVAPEPKGKGQQ